MMRLIIRGFANGSRSAVFQERVDVDEKTMADTLPAIAERHAEAMMLYERHMIEIEFLDEPDPLQRFMRFGTDPSGMVLPVKVGL